MSRPTNRGWHRHGLHQCFKYGSMQARGITDSIHEYFFPPDWKLYKMAGKAGEGSPGGCRVDSELRDWIGVLNKKRVKPAVVQRHLAKYSEFTRLIIRELRVRGLRPVGAQVVVGHVASRMATAVDLVVCDMNGKLGLWEIKTGYLGTFDAHTTHRMKTPVKHAQQRVAFEALPANPLNFALVQVVFTWILWSRTFPRRPISHRSVNVVNVTASGVKLYSVPPLLGMEIYTQLKSLKLVYRGTYDVLWHCGHAKSLGMLSSA